MINSHSMIPKRVDRTNSSDDKTAMPIMVRNGNRRVRPAHPASQKKFGELENTRQIDLHGFQTKYQEPNVAIQSLPLRAEIPLLRSYIRHDRNIPQSFTGISPANALGIMNTNPPGV
jgi:hypothetical protein